ncbi:MULTISPECIES: murein biosynthesis integral membrane protein MurJ [unclassified Exiguobacterium]|uniref:murein biosynthesis integral membrane protein MurJ n=1 Tax=unclassified Exiguobacterium TaxID=2644629 RepID=UPI001BE7FA56|nr:MULTISPECIES: murein biosynthesis integral membrane protein MurJ [unclassified Exiguobacterium]
MKRDFILVFIFTFISKGLGFVRDISLAYFYGANSITDAYLISLTIPGTIYEYVGIAITTSLIPIYFEVKKNKDLKYTQEFLNNLAAIVILFSLVLTIIIWITAFPLTKIIATGFDKEAIETTVLFTRIGSLSLAFSGSIFIINTLLQINKRYYLAIFAGIPASLFSIFIIFISYKTNSLFLGYSSLITVFVQFVTVYFLFKKTVFNIEFKLSKKPKVSYEIKGMLSIALPAFIGVAINQLNTIIDRNLASRIIEGGVSILNYSNKLLLFSHGLISVTLVSILYPIISKKISDNEGKKIISKFCTENIKNLILILFPINIIMLFYAEEIVNVLLGRGGMTDKSLYITISVFKLYSVSLVFLGVREFLLRIFFSYKKVKEVTILSIFSLCLNIFLSLNLYRNYGLSGLAFSTSVSTAISCLVMYIYINKKVLKIIDKKMLLEIFIIIVTSYLSIWITKKITFDFIHIFISAKFIINILMGTGLYTVIILLLIFFKIIKINTNSGGRK